MQHARRHRLRRAVAYAVLAAVLGLVSLTLSQCTLVGDNITGLNRNGSTNCIKGCNDAAFAAREQCKRDHETAREVCRLLPEGSPERTACEAEAQADRDACNTVANADKETCQTNCAHHQGSGSAG